MLWCQQYVFETWAIEAKIDLTFYNNNQHLSKGIDILDI